MSIAIKNELEENKKIFGDEILKFEKWKNVETSSTEMTRMNRFEPWNVRWMIHCNNYIDGHEFN